MGQLEQLRLKYKPSLKKQHKHVSDLWCWLENAFDIEEITLSDFSKAFIETLRNNAMHAITNKVMNISPDDMQFLALKLLDTERNRNYYEVPFKNAKEKFVYVIMETKTGYILTNHAKLQLELVIEQGVSQYDFDNETCILDYYISCIDRLAKQEY